MASTTERILSDSRRWPKDIVEWHDTGRRPADRPERSRRGCPRVADHDLPQAAGTETVVWTGVVQSQAAGRWLTAQAVASEPSAGFYPSPRLMPESDAGKIGIF